MADAPNERLSSALATDSLRTQVQQWHTQSEQLRATFRECWTAAKEGGFPEFWNGAENAEVRLAAVLSSFEDIGESIAGAESFIPVSCPELVAVMEDKSKIETVVWRLFQTLDSATENTRQNFDASAMTTNVAALVSGSTASFASDSLLVIRSCILLHFCLNVVLVIVNTQGEGGEDEGAEDADEPAADATPPSMLAP